MNVRMKIRKSRAGGACTHTHAHTRVYAHAHTVASAGAGLHACKAVLGGEIGGAEHLCISSG